ncbi:MAG: hypothetical protein U0169_23380 [Polyangiaceae bacterium]
MNAPFHTLRLPYVAACVASFVLSAGCASSADDEAVGTSSDALRTATWRVDKVRGVGVGCKFKDDARGPANAFVVANGNDVAVVFTQLGEATRLGPARRREWSRCAFDIPVDVPAGTYLSGFSQAFTYGIVKPAGLRAGLSIDTVFRGPLAGRFEMPHFERNFEKNDVLNVSMETVAATREVFPENQARYDRWKKRWCARNRDTRMTFDGLAQTWSERDKNGLEVVIAVDGLDAHVDMGADLTECPANP